MADKFRRGKLSTEAIIKRALECNENWKKREAERDAELNAAVRRIMEGAPPMWKILGHGSPPDPDWRPEPRESAPEPKRRMVVTLPYPPRPKPDAGFVYFIGELTAGPIKIGSSTNVHSRLRSLQTGSPVDLVVLAHFPTEDRFGDEHSLHEEFRHLRQRGEWFRRGDDLMEHIEWIQRERANE